MELVGEVMVLGIVEGIIAAPVVGVARTLYRAPLRFVLASNLVPERIELLLAVVHLVARRNIA
jgi:hypothetical protein